MVSGSVQAFDHTYLRAARQTLGPSLVGVPQLPPAPSDEDILDLHSCGGRAVRFTLRRGGSAGVSDLAPVARRVHVLVGWHVDLYVDARDLAHRSDVLVRLPVVVMDHLGLSRAGFPMLLELVERGICAKATGVGRLDFEPGPALRALARVHPDGLLFWTDLPSTRAPRPFQEQDLHLVMETLGREVAEQVLDGTAVRLYRPRPAEWAYSI